MVKRREYRIVLPFTCEEYRKGQIYSVAKASAKISEEEPDSGITLVKNEPFENEHGKGDYTERIYYLGSRVPGWVSAVLPSSALKLYECSWNAFPYCKTVVTHHMTGNRLTFTIESRHIDNDKGEQENIHGLHKKEWKATEVHQIDISDKLKDEYYHENEDCSIYKSEATGRGPLRNGWQDKATPVMCAYKLVTVEFKYFGFQTKMENVLIEAEGNIFDRFFRQVFCWTDDWYHLTLDEVREYEQRIEQKMNAKTLKKLQTDDECSDTKEEDESVRDKHDQGEDDDEYDEYDDED